MTTAQEQTCQEYISPRDRYESFRPRKCGRPLAAGRPVCKLHAAAADRREKARTDEHAAWTADEAREKETKGYLEAHGIAGSPEWRRPMYPAGARSYHTGSVILARTELERLVTAAEALPAVTAALARAIEYFEDNGGEAEYTWLAWMKAAAAKGGK